MHDGQLEVNHPNRPHGCLLATAAEVILCIAISRNSPQPKSVASAGILPTCEEMGTSSDACRGADASRPASGETAVLPTDHGWHPTAGGDLTAKPAPKTGEGPDLSSTGDHSTVDTQPASYNLVSDIFA